MAQITKRGSSKWMKLYPKQLQLCDIVNGVKAQPVAPKEKALQGNYADVLKSCQLKDINEHAHYLSHREVLFENLHTNLIYQVSLIKLQNAGRTSRYQFLDT